MGDIAMQKMPIRRVVLFPLRSGLLEIGSPFGLFEGSLTEISVASAPVTINTRPVPAGAAVAATGDLALRCVNPVQENGGPVVIDAVLNGKGNLRAAAPPHSELRRDFLGKVNNAV